MTIETIPFFSAVPMKKQKGWDRMENEAKLDGTIFFSLRLGSTWLMPYQTGFYRIHASNLSRFDHVIAAQKSWRQFYCISVAEYRFLEVICWNIKTMDPDSSSKSILEVIQLRNCGSLSLCMYIIYIISGVHVKQQPLSNKYLWSHISG